MDHLVWCCKVHQNHNTTDDHMPQGNLGICVALSHKYCFHWCTDKSGCLNNNLLHNLFQVDKLELELEKQKLKSRKSRSWLMTWNEVVQFDEWLFNQSLFSDKVCEFFTKAKEHTFSCLCHSKCHTHGSHSHLGTCSSNRVGSSHWIWTCIVCKIDLDQNILTNELVLANIP